MSADLEIRYRALETLKPYEANARTHSKQQIKEIANSIQASTFSNPILIDENDVIIAGHGRLLAAKSLGLQSVPTIQLTGLTEAQVRLLRIADNKIALNSGWDSDLLRIELDKLEIEGLDLELTGFSIGEIDILRQDGEDPDDDVVPAVPAIATSRSGDIWRLGPHRVACGDIRDAGLRERLIGAARADAAFLDPPYNVKINGHAGGRGKIKHREFAVASGELSKPEFVQFLKDAEGACAEVSRDGAVHFVCMDHGHAEEQLAAGETVYGARINLCVWVKSNAGMGGLYRSQHELVFVYRVGSEPHRNNVELGRHGRNRTNIWRYDSVNTFSGHRRGDLALHPTVKPVAMVADAIRDVTKPGELVLDAFLGSGTTLIAAQRTGRRFVGTELDPLYVDLTLERWAAMTGQAPLLDETGEAFDEVRCRRGADQAAE